MNGRKRSRKTRSLQRLAHLWVLLGIASACDTPSARPAGDRPSVPAEAPKPATPPVPTQPQTTAPSAARVPQPTEAEPLHYLEFTTGGAGARDHLPMVFALHGLGDRPDHFAGLFTGFSAPARFVVPRAPTPYSDGYSWFEYTRGPDETRTAEGIRAAAARVASLIARLRSERPTRGRAIVTGFSQGGMLSFELAVHHADQVAFAFPVGGWLPAARWPEVASTAPRSRIVALHGGADPRVPIGPTREGVERLARVGLAAELEEFPGVTHRISPEMRQRLFELLADAVASRQSRP